MPSTSDGISNYETSTITSLFIEFRFFFKDLFQITDTVQKLHSFLPLNKVKKVKKAEVTNLMTSFERSLLLLFR